MVKKILIKTYPKNNNTTIARTTTAKRKTGTEKQIDEPQRPRVNNGTEPP